MSNCVLSSQNGFYVEKEPSSGNVPTITSANRIAAVQLGIRQRLEQRERRDKTGSRTYGGVAPGGRKVTDFNLQTYLIENTTPSSPPIFGPLVEASLGGAPVSFAGMTAGTGSTTTQVVFSASHGLVKGQAIAFNGEIRFVDSVVDSTTVQVSAPFAAAPVSGATLTATVSYFPASELPSVSVFDYWDPSGAVDRILVGGSCGRFQVRVNADFHELEFIGEAQDVIDTESFASGEGGLSIFPAEPAVAGDLAAPIPGNLGQAWLGTPANKFLTVTGALLELDNDLDLRGREFGTTVPQCLAAGVRNVSASFELFEADDAATRGLYAAARAETPIGVMFQLGEASGQLMGVYMPNVVPQVPEFNDQERILQWDFKNARAQGQTDDEIYVAFG